MKIAGDSQECKGEVVQGGCGVTEEKRDGEGEEEKERERVRREGGRRQGQGASNRFPTPQDFPYVTLVCGDCRGSQEKTGAGCQ